MDKNKCPKSIFENTFWKIFVIEKWLKNTCNIFVTEMVMKLLKYLFLFFLSDKLIN